jgi:ABC-type oligopeptide transport system substrate-binding subunit
MLDALDSESRRYQTKIVLRRYFERAASSQPVALVLEDLHWADPSSLDVLEELLGLLDRVPTLLLALMRVDHDHGSWALTNKARTDYPHRYEEIHLRRLLAGEAKALIGELLGQESVPEGLKDLIQARAEGNPFYVEEVLRHLKETGVLVEGEAGWSLQGDLASIGIPDTLQGVLLARIDRLEEGVRETLQLASVIGRSFLYRILKAISEAEDELEGHLTELQRTELVRENARLPELEYIFKHALTQEAAYSSLLVERRRLFHLRVGEAIESLFPDRQDEFLGLLAHHFERADQPEKAAQYLIRAGDQARMEDALSEAEGFYKRAIEQSVGREQEEWVAHTWMKRALIYQSTASFQDAHAAYSKAFSIMKQVDDPVSRMRGDIPARDVKKNSIRIPVVPEFQGLDLTNVNNFAESQIMQDLYASLVEIDLELNVVPLVAKSWEILDQGKRYVFHLRDDVRWSNGEAVRSEDFVWTLLHRIRPDQEDYTSWLDEIEGAFEYRTGLIHDPLQVGIRSTDPLTLEVRLSKPTNYFIYLLTGPLGSPRYPKSVEEQGKDWWRPPNMVSNGPFVFTEFTQESGTLTRNPYYFGPTQGNLDTVRWQIYENQEAILQSYLEDLSDVVFWPDVRDIPEATPHAEVQDQGPRLRTMFLFLNPCKPPTDDILIRKAIAHAVDKRRFIELKNPDLTVAEGGLIPPGIPGHSLGFTPSYDHKQDRDFHQKAQLKAQKEVRKLMYVEGVPLSLSQEWNAFLMSELRKNLGMEVAFKSAGSRQEVIDLAPNIFFEGWLADFPAPINFLNHCAFGILQDIAGYEDSHLMDLLSAASTELDRSRQMELYREADRYIVEEQVYFIPLAYGGTSPDLVKPWVKNFRRNALGFFKVRDIFIDQTLRAELSKV